MSEIFVIALLGGMVVLVLWLLLGTGERRMSPSLPLYSLIIYSVLLLATALVVITTKSEREKGWSPSVLTVDHAVTDYSDGSLVALIRFRGMSRRWFVMRFPFDDDTGAACVMPGDRIEVTRKGKAIRLIRVIGH